MEEKCNKKTKGKIIVIFIIILLVVTGFGLYHLHSNKDNIVKYYTKEEIRNFVYEFPYTNVLKGNHTYEELWKAYKFKSVYDYLKIDIEKEIELNKNNLDKEKDANGETYGDYSQHRVKETAKAAGLTVEEIENRDNLFLWSKIVGPGPFINFFTIDGDNFKNAYIELYGNDNMFNESVLVNDVILNSDYDYSNSKTYLYDKNIKKVIMRIDMEFEGTKRIVEIINEEENDNEYIIEFVEGGFRPNPEFETKTYFLEYTDIEIDSLDDINVLRKVVKENIDKLKTYKVIFNITKKGYTYKSVS